MFRQIIFCTSFLFLFSSCYVGTKLFNGASEIGVDHECFSFPADQGATVFQDGEHFYLKASIEHFSKDWDMFFFKNILSKKTEEKSSTPYYASRFVKKQNSSSKEICCLLDIGSQEDEMKKTGILKAGKILYYMDSDKFDWSNATPVARVVPNDVNSPVGTFPYVPSRLDPMTDDSYVVEKSSSYSWYSIVTAPVCLPAFFIDLSLPALSIFSIIPAIPFIAYQEPQIKDKDNIVSPE